MTINNHTIILTITHNKMNTEKNFINYVVSKKIYISYSLSDWGVMFYLYYKNISDGDNHISLNTLREKNIIIEGLTEKQTQDFVNHIKKDFYNLYTKEKQDIININKNIIQDIKEDEIDDGILFYIEFNNNIIKRINNTIFLLKLN